MRLPESMRVSTPLFALVVAIMAPDNEAELDADLELLNDWRPPASNELNDLLAHGDRVYEHAGKFP